MILALSLLGGLIGSVVAFKSLRGDQTIGVVIGLLMLVLSVIPVAVLPHFGAPKPGIQAIDKQWDVLRQAIPDWRVQNLLVLHHPDQKAQARALGEAVENASYAEVRDPLSMEIMDVSQVEFRILAEDFAALLKQHANADLIVVMPGLPAGLAELRLPKTQRLVLADLGPGQWAQWSRHPNVFAGVLSGDRSSPGWRIETKGQ